MRCIYIGLLSLLTLFIYSLWSQTVSNAATRSTDDFAEMVRAAQAVIEAEVVNIAAVRDPLTATVQTTVRLQIVKIYKGRIDASSIKVVYAGGDDGNERTIAPGQPSLLAGHRYVLMIAQSPGEPENWRVIAGDAGQVELSTNNGESIAQRPEPLNFEYYAADPKSLTGITHFRTSEMTAATFKALLKTILATGKPVLPGPSPTVPKAVPTQSASIPASVRFLLTVLLTTIIWHFGRRYTAKNIKRPPSNPSPNLG
jgi:hypothetical protein